MKFFLKKRIKKQKRVKKYKLKYHYFTLNLLTKKFDSYILTKEDKKEMYEVYEDVLTKDNENLILQLYKLYKSKIPKLENSHMKNFVKFSQKKGKSMHYTMIFANVFKNFFFKKNFLNIDNKEYILFFKNILKDKKSFNRSLGELLYLIKPVFIVKVLRKIKRKSRRKRKNKKKIKFLKKILYLHHVKRLNTAYKYLYLDSIKYKDAKFFNRFFKSIVYNMFAQKNSKLYKHKVKIFKMFYKRHF